MGLAQSVISENDDQPTQNIRKYNTHLEQLKFPKECYADWVAKKGRGEGFITGGGDEFNMEYDSEVKSLESDYDSALSVKDNNAKINKSFTAVVNALKIKTPSGVISPDDKVTWMQENVPNPRKGKSIIANKDKQRTMCQDIARSVNKEYGRTIIDVNAPSEIICNSVCDQIDTLGMGSHKQFVGVAASVQRGLNNLMQLRALLDSTYTRLYNDASQSDDDRLSAKTAGMDQLHKALMQELDRQIQLLANLTTTTLKPVDRDLIEVLRNNKEFRGVISGLGDRLGSKETGAKLSYWLNEVSNVASVASQVNKALKTVGMTLSEYRKTSKLSDIKLKADELMRAKPRDKITRKYLGKFHAAVDVLADNHGQHDAIITYLSKHKDGAYDGGDMGQIPANDQPLTIGIGGGMHDDDVSDEYDGGRIRLTEKLNKQAGTKRSILKSFKDKSHIYFDRILTSTMRMAKRMGVSIPLTYHLDRFIKTFKELEVVANRDGMEYALTGYQHHATAIAERNKFIGILKSVNDSIDPLISGKGGDSFTEIKANLVSMLKLIDYYSEQVNVYEDPKVQHFQEETTGAGSDYSGGREFNASTNIRRTVETLEHFYNIAKMKANLSVVSEESSDYNNNYETLLGEAMGNKINELETQYENLSKEMNGTGTSGTDNIHHDLAKWCKMKELKANVNGHSITNKDFAMSHVLQYRRNQLNGKKELYKALQAIDLYLQHFTDNVAKDPDNIKEISKILESVEAISTWFNNTSGDYVATLFESFPYLMHTSGVAEYNKMGVDPETLSKTTLNGSRHYYEHTRDAIEVRHNLPAGSGGNTGVGIPFLPITPMRANNLQKYVKKTYEKVFALKNLISLFAYLGDKFGTEAVSSKVFMSPNQIYQSLLSYLCVSSMSMGWKKVVGKTIPAVAPNSQPTNTYTVIKSSAPVADYNVDNTSNQEAAQGHTYIGPTVCNMAAELLDQDVNTESAQDSKNRAMAILKGMYGVVMTPSAPRHDAATRTEESTGWKDDFESEDMLFAHAIKAMAAKVFTVAGLYNIMNFKTQPVPVLSTHRIILGGDDRYQTPIIHDEAVDLYIRLPLLAEFYLHIFGFNTSQKIATSESDRWQIAMVPEVDSIWSGFVKCIFEHPDRSAATYTDNQSRRVINEINGIYQRYKTKYTSSDLVLRVINDFVAEINRRYGVVSVDEMNDYIRQDRISRREMYTGPDIIDYDILDEDKTGTGVAPSDMHAKLMQSSRNTEKTEDWHYKLVCDFRNKIDLRIRSAVAAYESTGSKARSLPRLTNQIQLTRESLNGTKSNDEKFKIVVNTIQGIDYVSKKGEDALLMFNELVVAPLVVLTKIQSMLKQFTYRILQMDVASAFKAIVKGLSGGKLATAHTNAVAATAATARVSANASDQQLRDPLHTVIDDLPAYMRDSIDPCRRAIMINKYDVNHTGYGLATSVTDTYPMNYQGVTGRHSLWGIIRNVNTVAGDNKKENITCAVRHLINWESLYKTMTNLIFGISVDLDGLVTVKTHGPNMLLDTSRLQQYCEDTVAGIRANIDKLRGSVSEEIIAKYEKYETHGSINWLQENLMDTLFGNKVPHNVSACTKVISDAYVLFVKKWKSSLPADTTVAYDCVRVNDVQWSFDACVSEITHYNTNTMNLTTDSTGIQNLVSLRFRNMHNNAGARATMGQFMSNTHMTTVDLETDSLYELHRNPDPNSPYGSRVAVPIGYNRRLNIYLDGSDKHKLRGDYHHTTREYGQGVARSVQHVATRTDAGEGLMMKFNELLNKYINQFVDVGNNKMYVNVLGGFATGSHHSDVMSGYCWPDIVPDEYAQKCVIAATEWGKAYDTGTYASNSNANNGIANMNAKSVSDEDANTIRARLVEIGAMTAGSTIIDNVPGFGTIGTGGGVPGVNWANATNVPQLNGLSSGYNTVGVTAKFIQYYPMIQIGAYLIKIHADDSYIDGWSYNRDNDQFIINKLGDPEGIVFASLGKKLRTIYGETSPSTNAKKWLHDNISDVTPSMKENYRANMPLFAKWFRAIAKKAELVKQTLSMGLSCERYHIPALYTDVNTSGLLPIHRVRRTLTGALFRGRAPLGQNNSTATVVITDPLSAHTGTITKYYRSDRLLDKSGNQLSYGMEYKSSLTKEQARVYYTSLCDNITSGCESILGCIAKVTSELNDTPKFLEVHENSIASYRNANGVLPLMPFSSTIGEICKPRPNDNLNDTSTMNTVDQNSKLVLRNADISYPFYSLQHSIFEFNYGNRLVLHDQSSKPVLEHFPGMKDILSKYNSVSINTKKVDESVFAEHLSKITYLTRYLFDTRLIGTLLGADKNVFDNSDFIEHTDAMFPYQSTTQLSDTIKLTKGSDKTYQIELMIRPLSGDAAADMMDRKDAVVFNIIDMNIMPINVHQLRKEIPLANLYNYSCTFDAYLRDILNITTLAGGAANNTHDIMYNLCVRPYDSVDKEVYDTHLKYLMQGDSTIDVEGRPKFISDQIWNKVLFNEVFAEEHDANVHDNPPRSRHIRTTKQNYYGLFGAIVANVANGTPFTYAAAGSLANIINGVNPAGNRQLLIDNVIRRTDRALSGYAVMKTNKRIYDGARATIINALTDVINRFGDPTTQAGVLPVGSNIFTHDYGAAGHNITSRIVNNDFIVANATWFIVNNGSIINQLSHEYGTHLHAYMGNNDSAIIRRSATDVLTYLDEKSGVGGKEVKSTEEFRHIGMVHYLRKQGQNMRFNTKFIRNLVFFSNVQRVIHMKLRNEVQKAPYPILTSTAITNRDLTEYSNDHTAGLNID